MSEFKNKSDYNRLAADKLMKEHLYAPSVHCSYYRCVQLMLHVLFEKLKVVRADFDSQMRQRNGGTHAHAIHLIGMELIKKKKDDYKDFQKIIPKLKEYREKSDYSDEKIDQPFAQEAYSKADAIVNILNTNF